MLQPTECHITLLGQDITRLGPHQRVQALVLNATLLLLDEPLEGLAPIIVEQHPQAILAISDHTAVLDRGCVVHSGSAAELKQNPALLDRLVGVVIRRIICYLSSS